MAKIIKELKYTKEHEWVKVEGDSVTVGITDYAQEALGDIVFIEEVEVDSEVEIGDTISTIESVKAVSDLFAPLQGKVTEINENIKENPAIVNSDPYGAGWIFKMTITNQDQLSETLDSSQYEEFLKTL